MMMGFHRKAILLSGILALLTACGAREAEIAAPLEPQPYGQEAANIELWLDQLEVSSRELYAARAEVVAAIGVRKGARIADIGAGTGLYSLLFAEQIGESGVVYAVDIEPRFLKLINQRASDEDRNNVTAVLGRMASVPLPAQSLDIAFISDTYNYFEDPEAMMKSVYRAMRPGGVLYILDFDIIGEDKRTDNNAHIRVGKQALTHEVEASGFTFDREVEISGLDETYMLRFVRRK